MVRVKTSYYLFNRQELLQKGKGRYHNGGGKEKAAENCIENKEVLKENAKIKTKTCLKKKKQKENMDKNKYRIMTKDETSKLKEYQRKYQAVKK